MWYPEGPREDGRRDPDRLPDVTVCEWLVDEFGAQIDSLRASATDLLSDLLFDARVRRPYQQWIVPCAARGKLVPSSGSFCPVCLACGETAYFRMEWRVALLTHCPEHGCCLVDRCPGCGALIWPAPTTTRSRFESRWQQMWQCYSCRSDLRQHAPIMDGHEASSQTLWKAVLSRSKPPGAPAIASPREYFSALWLITRLVRQNHSSFLRHLPGQCQPPPHTAESKGRARIEMLSVAERISPISSALWLLEDWPDRFIKTAKLTGITGKHFLRTQSEYPSWMQEVVLDRFMLRNKWIGHAEVTQAIDVIKKRGDQVSKNAVRRFLNVTENRAIDDLLDQRRKATMDELFTLCRKFDRLVEVTPPARDQQRVLARDFLMLLISIFSGRRIEDVCKMTSSVVKLIVAAGQKESATDPRVGCIGSLLVRLHDQYAHGTRPFFVVRGDKPRVWFLSRFGEPLEGHSVRDQIAKLMKQDFDQDLWRSADVFRDALEGHQL